MDQIRGLLQQYVGESQGAGNPHQDFDQVAQAAPQSALAQGIAGAFRSDSTPPFEQMVAHLFDQSNGQQRAGLLNQVLGAVGPSVIQQVLGRFGLSGLAGALQGGGQVTPQQANQVPTQAVQELASQAQGTDPSVVDQVSQFLTGHPDLVKSLGAGALSSILSEVGIRI